LARLVALEMDKALARREGVERPQRAAVRHGPSGIPIADPFAFLCPWQAWLDPPPRWPERLGNLDEPHRAAVTRRYGLDGTPPLAIPALARVLGTTKARAARLAQEGEGQLRWMRAL
ncbi:MAG: hypothetical protein KDA22_00145, partial [Phycisphaerales bacterium]|nr:hypothetical protein [Phycisphaerales bacterium]